MNGYSYLVVGLDYKPAARMMGDQCGRPRCPMAIPTKPTLELQPQYAATGFEKTQPAPGGSDNWEPDSIGGMEFPTDELARNWLNSTQDGTNFKDVFKYVFIARVRG
jgi:hypothetical protein